MAADETPRSEPSDTSVQPSPHIRLRVDLVVEIADADALTRSALEHVARDELMPDEEREHTEEIISGDSGEALACLVDPFDLVRELPGVELAHASWGSEEMDAGELDAFSFLDADETEAGAGYEKEDEAGDEAEDESAARGGRFDALEDRARGAIPEAFRENVHGLDGASR